MKWQYVSLGDMGNGHYRSSPSEMGNTPVRGLKTTTLREKWTTHLQWALDCQSSPIEMDNTYSTQWADPTQSVFSK